MSRIDGPPVSTFPAYKPNSHYGLEPARNYAHLSNDAFERECQDIAARAAAKEKKAGRSLMNRISRFIQKLIK